MLYKYRYNPSTTHISAYVIDHPYVSDKKIVVYSEWPYIYGIRQMISIHEGCVLIPVDIDKLDMEIKLAILRNI